VRRGVKDQPASTKTEEERKKKKKKKKRQEKGNIHPHSIFFPLPQESFQKKKLRCIHRGDFRKKKKEGGPVSNPKALPIRGGILCSVSV
jgi:hypothetical protein